MDVAQGQVNGRRITSRLGHIVELADGGTPETQHVLLQLADQKSRLRLGKDRVDVEVPGGVPIAMKSGDSSLTIGADGSITIRGTSVTIEAQHMVSISTTARGGQAELKAGGVTVESEFQTAIKGGAIQVEASELAEIKGPMVKIN